MEKNVQEKDEQELLTVSSGEMFQPYDWSVGKFGSKFLHELKENKKLIGSKCPKCNRVFIPPRKVCGQCFAAMDEFVPVSDEGEVYASAIIEFGFVDPETGKKRPVPYGYAFIKLDGADTCLSHFVDSVDPEKFKVGARVKAVFEDERKGSLMDIRHFELI